MSLIISTRRPNDWGVDSAKKTSNFLMLDSTARTERLKAEGEISFVYSPAGLIMQYEGTNILKGNSTIISQFGTFDTWGTGGVSVLTDESVGSAYSQVACVSSGAEIIYEFTTSAKVDSINLYSAWGDGGRANMNITVYYSLVNTPSDYILLGTAAGAASGSPPHVKASIVRKEGLSFIADGVKRIKFYWGGQQSGSVGYPELQVVGKV